MGYWISVLTLLFISFSFAQKSQVNLVKSEPKITKAWGLVRENSAFKVSKIPSAFSIAKSKTRVKVAIIDTGVDFTKHELNNYVVDGYDFVRMRSDSSNDVMGHGTHVAGIVVAASNEKADLVAVKFYSESARGSKNLSNTVKALNFAIDRGVRVINYSGGGPEYNEDEFRALKRAEANGIVVVAAAGNDGHNVDVPELSYYPSGYPGLTNVISVMSVDYKDKKPSYSNWGKNKVDVAAPGEAVLSTIPGGYFGKMNGTSQSTALVSGVVALILSENPNLKPHEVKQIVLYTSRKVKAFEGLNASNGVLDAAEAVIAAKKFTGSKK